MLRRDKREGEVLRKMRAEITDSWPLSGDSSLRWSRPGSSILGEVSRILAQTSQGPSEHSAPHPALRDFRPVDASGHRGPAVAEKPGATSADIRGGFRESLEPGHAQAAEAREVAGIAGTPPATWGQSVPISGPQSACGVLSVGGGGRASLRSWCSREL